MKHNFQTKTEKEFEKYSYENSTLKTFRNSQRKKPLITYYH